MDTAAYLEEVVITLAFCIVAIIAFNIHLNHFMKKDDDDDKK